MQVMTECQNTALAARSEELIGFWMSLLHGVSMPYDLEISVYLIDPDRMQVLNISSRNKNKPTNILTFVDQDQKKACAELMICLDVIAQEADTLGILFEEQLAHIFIHGILHAYGHDHQENEAALRMQKKESELMRYLDYDDPWREDRC